MEKKLFEQPIPVLASIVVCDICLLFGIIMIDFHKKCNHDEIKMVAFDNICYILYVKHTIVAVEFGKKARFLLFLSYLQIAPWSRSCSQ